MKSIIILILILILSITQSDAQYFSKHYAVNGSWARSIVQYDDTSFVVLTAQNNYDTAIAYLRINDTGKVLHYQYLSLGINSQVDEGLSNDIVKLNDNSIVLASTYQSSGGQLQPLIIKFNAVGNIAWSKTLNDSGYVLIRQTRSTAHGGFFLLGTRKLALANDAALILIKTDSMGNEQWHRIYDTPGLEDFVSNFEKITDDSFLIAEEIGISSGFSQGKVFAIDSLGNVKWQNLFNDPKEKKAGGRISSSTEPNMYYYCGYGYDTTDVYHGVEPNYYPPYFEKINKNTGVVWRSFIPTQFESLNMPAYVKTFNNNMYVLGFSYDSSINNGNSTAIFAKFDSMGNLKWRQNYFKRTRTLANNYLSDFVQTKDGGFMLCGSSWDTLNGLNVQCTWIVRVDSNGCEVANCIVKDTTHNVGIGQLEIKENDFKLFPNPCNQSLVISRLSLGNTKVEVVDVLGRELEDLKMSRLGNEIQVDVSRLVSGIYFLKITDEKRMVRIGKFVKE